MAILCFEDITSDQLQIVGGKGLNLGLLSQAGLPVPPGFVITTDAYSEMDNAGLAAGIAAAYRDLGGGPVAVRSSATAEDLPDASFAGQQDTFLNVEGEEALLRAVRGCWASLQSERARAYRASQGSAEEGVAMAVVVQRMVAPRCAGVLFTAGPTQPERMLLEAVAGLGEALVSGEATPERWSLARETGEVIEHQPPPGQSTPHLEPREIEALWKLGLRVRDLFGGEQDIEWAIAGGEVSLLQTRPITAAAGEREAVRAEEIARLKARAEPGGTVWARYSVAEVLPEPLPFTWALWRDFMSGGGGYGRMYRDLGYDPDPALETDGVLDLIAGRPYFNLSRDARLYFAGFPYEYPFAKLKADPELAIYPQVEANLARAPKGFLLKMIGYTRKMMAAERALERCAVELPEHLETRVFPGVSTLGSRWLCTDLFELSRDEILAAITKVREELFQTWAPDLLKASIMAGLAVGNLQAELTPRLGEAEAKQALGALLAGADPPARCNVAAGLRDLRSGALSLDSFICRFGHRGPNEMELAAPRWREMYDVTSAMAGSHPAPPPEPLSPPAIELDGKAAELLKRARKFTALREASKHYLMEGYEALRRLMLELDRSLQLGGGAFYLEPEELTAAGAGEDFRGRIVARRKRRALALGLEAPRVLFSDDPEAIGRPVPVDTGAETVCGTGVSPGVAEGDALVLRSPVEAPPNVRDFILVCPSTDPGWVPLFLKARGVVLETGGILSHGAIVAREFGLPAVVNIPDACRRFRTGQHLRVDGSAGAVHRIDNDPPA